VTVNRFFMPAIVILALLGTVGITQVTGDWIVSGRQIVTSGSFIPEDIKGWMTLQQIAEGMGLPVATVYQLAGVPDGSNIPATTALKDLEKLVPGFKVTALRDAITAYLEASASAEGTSPVQVTAEPVATAAETAPARPEATPTVTPDSATLAPTATPHTPQGQGDGTGTGPTPLSPGQILSAVEIKGSMTLQQVADQCAVPLDKLLAALKLPSDQDPTTQIKLLTQTISGFEVQMVRDAVAALQQK
jgi:antitoxin component of RelBE/YafQ-DinJ toxin-antitoxin module